MQNLTNRIKNIRTLVKIYQRKEQPVWIHLTVSPGVCNHQKFLMCLPTITALVISTRILSTFCS